MKTFTLAAAMSFTALATAQGAQAQQACIEPDDLTDTITYAIPLVYDGLQERCAAQFSQNEFMRDGADEFVDEFRAGQDAAWPGALRLLKTFMSSQDGDDDGMAEMVASLPDDALRPLVDGIIPPMLGERLGKDGDTAFCGDIAEGMELVAPLPAQNVSMLVTFIAERVGLEDPSICSAENTGQVTISAE